MTRWIDLYVQKGTYISKEFDVSSHFESYLYDLFYNYHKNDGTVDIYIRISYDGSTWEDWMKINDVAVLPMFENDFYYMESCKFQYKVEMVNNGLTSPTFENFSFVGSGSYIINNIGDITSKPELWIKKINASGDIKLRNESNGQELVFTALNKDETVYIDCENEDITTDLPLKYRIKDHNNVFLELQVGDNVLTGEGDFELAVRYEFKLLQG